MATDIHTIVLKGTGHHDEGIADGAIRPGAAVELASDGKYDEAQAGQAASIKGGLKVAKEAVLSGLGTGKGGKTITDAYAQNDTLYFYTPQPGDHIHVLVKSGEDIDVGANLVVEGGGSGLFVEASGSEAKFQLEALEDTGGSLSGNTHVKARVL